MKKEKEKEVRGTGRGTGKNGEEITEVISCRLKFFDSTQDL